MGFAHRIIHASRSHIPVKLRLRLSFPTSPKTLGDHIRAKRFEKHLDQCQAAKLMGVPEDRLIRWQLDRAVPSAEEWAKAVRLLGLDPSLCACRPNS